MISRSQYKGGVWIDLEQPTPDEIQKITGEFGISEQFENEILAPTPSALVAGDARMALLVLHFPAHGAGEGDTKDQEVDFIVGHDFIVTVRYEVIVPLHHLKKLLETKEFADEGIQLATDVLLEILFAHLYTAVRDQASHTASRVTHVEREMFGGRERFAVRMISTIAREFLHLEAALANQAEPLSRFLRVLARQNFFGPSFSERSERILAEHAQVTRLVETHRAVATELRETNNALLETRQNDIMKTLTVITVIVLPLELVAVTLEIRANGTPILGDPNAFWIIIAIMLGIAGCMILFFARKRWIF